MHEGSLATRDGEVLRFAEGRLLPCEHRPVTEFPLRLIVNGRELATLIASPHDLRFLVAGFLRLQGFVDSVDDFLMLSVCDDAGISNVRIRKEPPEHIRPVLTSGCGAGITFNLPGSKGPDGERRGLHSGMVTSGAVFSMMDELSQRAERYRAHGGIHSAAVGDGETVLLYTEDIGRHNTVDRLAGEALLKRIDLGGKMLVTSGRVSSEMAAKAALLGISLIASRTSPTDMAVRICDAAGITLIGYLRGGKFTVYCHSERIMLAPPV